MRPSCTSWCAPSASKRLIGAPIQSLFERGNEDGTIRNDLEPQVLARMFGGTLAGSFEAQLARTVGLEQAAAVIASLFLDGARNRT
jgi:hypothetical protein